MRKPMIAILIALAGTCPLAHATSPAKQELMQKVLALWRIGDIGQAMLQEPVAEAVQQARVVLQGRVPSERQDAAMRDIAADAKSFLDHAAPVVRRSTDTLIPVTVVPLLDERFTEDELRQIVAILESPVKRKFESLVPEMQKALGERLASETRPLIDPRLEQLRQQIGARLRNAVAQ